MSSEESTAVMASREICLKRFSRRIPMLNHPQFGSFIFRDLANRHGIGYALEIHVRTVAGIP